MASTSALSATAAVAGGTALLYSGVVGGAAAAVGAVGYSGADARQRIALAEYAALAIIVAASLGAAFASGSAAPAIVGGLAAGGLHYWWGQILA